jgi:hypothetical protein
VQIPKSSGRGFRVLTLQNTEDRVVAKAAAMVLGAALDGRFHPLSFGFRPDRDRFKALATALGLARLWRLSLWVAEDIADAFDSVPLRRLLDVCQTQLPSSILELLRTLLTQSSARGLPQGSPLSPLMLNAYLDHHLDRVWDHTQAPLIRTADDLLLLTANPQQAREHRSGLAQRLRSAAMPLRDASSSGCRDLERNEEIRWLGFRLCGPVSAPTIRIDEGQWRRLESALEEAQSAPWPAEVAEETILGWVNQLGACYRGEDPPAVLQRLEQTARRCGFDEPPEPDELLRRWRAAYARWQRCQKEVDPRDLWRKLRRRAGSGRR